MHIQILRQKKVVWLSNRTGPFVIVLIEAARMENQLMPLAHLGVGCKRRQKADGLCNGA